MSLSLADVARLVDGQLYGPGDIQIHGAATIACALSGEITLADNAKLQSQLSRSPAAAVIVASDFHPDDKPYIVVDDVHKAFAKVVQHFRPVRPLQAVGVSPAAWVAASASLGEGVSIHPQAYVGEDVEIGPRSIIHPGVRLLNGCRIGADVTIFPNAVLYENTIVGNRVLIHAGAVLGAYGFGYTTVEGKHQLSSQLGWVEVDDDVEIGACTTIDRGTYGPTRIGGGTKIDNQVMIAHNCRIGKHNLICSQVGIAGSSSTGDYVVMAGQVGARDHIHIGDGAVIGAKAGLMYDVPAGRRYFGSPATEEKHQFQCVSLTLKLPQMRKQIIELQRAIADLTSSSQAEAPPERSVQQTQDAA
jgi:UDP-3-O-[3-hydroxymyristoyl] glucosamine N-acyltransferase